MQYEHFEFSDQRYLIDNLIDVIANDKIQFDSLSFRKICTQVRVLLEEKKINYLPTEGQQITFSFAEKEVKISPKEFEHYSKFKNNENVMRAVLGVESKAQMEYPRKISFHEELSKNNSCVKDDSSMEVVPEKKTSSASVFGQDNKLHSFFNNNANNGAIPFVCETNKMQNQVNYSNGMQNINSVNAMKNLTSLTNMNNINNMTNMNNVSPVKGMSVNTIPMNGLANGGGMPMINPYYNPLTPQGSFPYMQPNPFTSQLFGNYGNDNLLQALYNNLQGGKKPNNINSMLNI